MIEKYHGLEVVAVDCLKDQGEMICRLCAFDSGGCDDIPCSPSFREDMRDVFFILADKQPATPESNGSSADYYDLPEGATRLQDLISFRNMNAQDGEIFRAIFRKGHCPHSSPLRDAKKILFYAQEEVARLEKLG